MPKAKGAASHIHPGQNTIYLLSDSFEDIRPWSDLISGGFLFLSLIHIFDNVVLAELQETIGESLHTIAFVWIFLFLHINSLDFTLHCGDCW